MRLVQQEVQFQPPLLARLTSKASHFRSFLRPRLLAQIMCLVLHAVGAAASRDKFIHSFPRVCMCVVIASCRTHFFSNTHRLFHRAAPSPHSFTASHASVQSA